MADLACIRATVEAVSRLYDIAEARGDARLSAAALAVGSHVSTGSAISSDDRWAVVAELMSVLCGPMASRWPVIDEIGGEWSEEHVEAAHQLIEEVTR